MSLVAPEEPVVASIVTTGLLLVALSSLEKLSLSRPSAAAVIEATGVSKSSAYAMRATILALLPTVHRPPGRPAAALPPVADTGSISRSILRFLMEHPGAVTPGETRQRYSDAFRHRVMELVEDNPFLDRTQMAEAVNVPPATLEDWLAEPVVLPAPAPTAPASASAPAGVTDALHPQIASVLNAWSGWSGGFAAFCVFVRVDLAIPFGMAMTRRILEVHAGRRGKRRPGRSPDEKALRGALISFFPGAQWFADGSSISFTLNGEKHTFNWELGVDGSSGAFVGASVRDEEDAQAVIEAFTDGVLTTGAAPIAFTTDNRAANLTPEVEAALGDTFHIRTTPGRPQNDAPIEGAFGLFAQTAPPLVVSGSTDRELAHAFLVLALTIWARATNHRPRNGRRGRSRVQLYRDEVISDERITTAKAALEERRRLQVLAAQTREARLNPIVRALLDQELLRLGLTEATANIKDAIARYPHAAVLAGLATFEGKRRAATLPPGVGSRYLLGIVHNIAVRDEGLAIAEVLWRLRLAARDRALVALDDARTAAPGRPEDRVRTFIERAMAGDGTLARSFWLHAAAEVILACPPELRKNLYDLAARRITGTFRVPPRDRQAAVRVIAAMVLPVA